MVLVAIYAYICGIQSKQDRGRPVTSILTMIIRVEALKFEKRDRHVDSCSVACVVATWVNCTSCWQRLSRAIKFSKIPLTFALRLRVD